jgi:DNA-binding MarR family transcriptional regulator
VANKRKRNDLDQTAEIEILKTIDMNCKRKETADKFGMDVSNASKITRKLEKSKDYHWSLSFVYY